MLNDIGINESLANSLFTDLELNKTELERLIKTNMDEKYILNFKFLIESVKLLTILRK
jgi:hypothetical protein